MNRSTTRDNLIKKIIFVLISAVFWTALWDFISYKVGMKYVLPSPAVTFKRLYEMMGESEFYLYAGNSLLSILKGFIGGALIGTVLGALSAFLKGVDILFSPLNTVIKATPVASFIILAFIWMNNSDIPVLISVLMITPIVWSALKSALQNVDRELIEMANTYKIPFFKRITALYLPSVLPSYLTALVTAMGLGWKAGIAAEVLCGTNDTLGNGLLTAKTYLETVDMFAYTVAIVVLSVIIELAFRAIIKAISRKERRNGTA
ncbi:MAG: ABC transporter permease subunit [Clostridia bacterium]|nr:ABC transporter permease subunit [Clostridia bacterium]